LANGSAHERRALVRARRLAGAQVLKVYAEPLLSAVLPDDPTFAKARELLELLAHVNAASSSTVRRLPATDETADGEA
jgi:hypothetical protein